jgi:putative transposase
VTVKIPKTRTGSFFPSLLEPRRRIDVALHAVICQAYVEGVSTRRVDDLVVAMGGTGISKSEVSRICAQLDEDVAAWRSRPLDEIAFPYVFLDATYCKARVNKRVVSQAVVIATGVSADGRREVLGCAVGDSETEAFWTEFLRSLRDRGLSGVQLVISDCHRGLTNAIGTVLQGAAWQRSSADITVRRDLPVGHLRRRERTLAA